MSKELFREKRMNEYFDSLPPYVQETILQSGAKPDTLDCLESMAKNLLKNDTL